MTNQYPQPVQSVTELTRSINGLIGTHFSFVTVRGEVSNLRVPFSGHTYFTLKDDTAQIRAVLFKKQAGYLDGSLRDGQQVICTGRVSVYEQRGEYQLMVDFVDFKGVGPLQAAFEKLKEKLSGEGLFDQARKKSLPFLPECIGLLTSPTGAAVHDFLRIAQDRFPAAHIEIYPVKVQGNEAAAEIIQALQQANERNTCQVIVLCRGGGSLEDLWVFNEEAVARAIGNSDIPVVSAVGHEIDFTIADFVADFRAPTPTAAAEAVLPDQYVLKEKCLLLTRKRNTAVTRILEEAKNRVSMLRRLVTDPSSILQHQMLRLDYNQSTMLHAMSNHLNRYHNRIQRCLLQLSILNPASKLEHNSFKFQEVLRRLKKSIIPALENRRAELFKASSLLDAVSPLAVLGRGYSIARLKDNKVLRSYKQVETGDEITITLLDGNVECLVSHSMDND